MYSYDKSQLFNGQAVVPLTSTDDSGRSSQCLLIARLLDKLQGYNLPLNVRKAITGNSVKVNPLRAEGLGVVEKVAIGYSVVSIERIFRSR